MARFSKVIDSRTIVVERIDGDGSRPSDQCRRPAAGRTGRARLHPRRSWPARCLRRKRQCLPLARRALHQSRACVRRVCRATLKMRVLGESYPGPRAADQKRRRQSAGKPQPVDTRARGRQAVRRNPIIPLALLRPPSPRVFAGEKDARCVVLASHLRNRGFPLLRVQRDRNGGTLWQTGKSVRSLRWRRLILSAVLFTLLALVSCKSELKPALAPPPPKRRQPLASYDAAARR